MPRTPAASNIIAVDPVALKRENAQELGATHAVETMEEATELAKQFTNGQGADSAIITVGVIKPEYVGQAMASIRKAGTVVVTALGNIADTTPLPVSLADVTLFQKRIQGSLFGESNPNWDILPPDRALPRPASLKLDEVITKTYTLDEVAAGLPGHARRQEPEGRRRLRLIENTANGGAALGTAPPLPVRRDSS